MAYITKAEVEKKSEALRALNKEYGVTARFSGSNSSSLTLTITAGIIDFIEDSMERVRSSVYYNQPGLFQHALKNARKSGNINVNHFYISSQWSGTALEYLEKAYAIMLDGHTDTSDLMTDYFCCSWYNSIQIGKCDRHYVLKGEI